MTSMQIKTFKKL